MLRERGGNLLGEIVSRFVGNRPRDRYLIDLHARPRWEARAKDRESAQPDQPATDTSAMHLPRRPLAVALAFTAAVAVVQARCGTSVLEPPLGAVADDRGTERIVGVIDGLPITTPLGVGAPFHPDTGDEVWLWSPERLVPGERIAVTGRLRTPRGMLDPGAPPLASRAGFEMSAQTIERLGDASTWRTRTLRWARGIQHSWVTIIDDAAGSSDGAAALRGIITGDRGAVPVALDGRWRACGIFHALSVSGLHLAVVAGLAFALLRRLIAGSPWGGRVRPARWAVPPALALAIAYTLVTGAQVATLRSLVVIAIMLIAQFMERPIRLVDALGLALVALLVWHPSDLRDPSFQLSFAAALALALRPRLAGASSHRVLRWLRDGIVTSAWVTLVTAPITALHFHQVQPGGVIGNLILTPLLELVALPLGLAGVALDVVWPAAGALAIQLAAATVGFVDLLAGWFARVAPVGAVAVGSISAMTVLVGLSLWLRARTTRRSADVVAWLALCATWMTARMPPAPGALRVTFLDVGQGDGAIIELPNGAAWIVDAGGLAGRHDLAAASAPGRAVARALETYGHARIELAIISHPHPDHYLGLAAISLPIDELWSPAGDPTPRDGSPRSAALPSFAELATAPIRHPPLGLVREEAGVEVWVWGPRFRERELGPEREEADPVRTVNDNSLVVELRFAGRSILFAGDVEAEGEAAVVTAGLHHVDVVKVGHHGSPTSSSALFVAATHPGTAVISCGVANTFGFPSSAVTARWRAVGATVERTDTSGAITVTITPDGQLAVDRFRRPAR